MPKYIKARYCGRLSWYTRKINALNDKIRGVNENGASLYFFPEDIVEEVECEWEELDWHGTNIDQPDSEIGWLDRDGHFYGCGHSQHDRYAELLLKTTTGELNERGWVHISDSPGCGIFGSWRLSFDFRRSGGRLSAEQRNWLSRNGHVLGENDQ